MATRKCGTDSRILAKRMAWGMILVWVVSLVVIIISMFVAKSAHAAEPSTFASLQPFQKFGKGDGEGIAYRYEARTKAQFIALLRDKNLAKKEMRVTCEVLVRQMVEAHKDLPFEGCEGAAAAIVGDDFTVVACKDEMFQRGNSLIVTNETGTAFGTWHRKCYPNEKVLVHKDQPLISTTCLNVAVPASQLVPSAPAPKQLVVPTATAVCPKGIVLFANAWTMDSLPPDLLEKAQTFIKKANGRDSDNASRAAAYQGQEDFSGALSDELINRVNVRAPLNIDIAVQLLDPKTLLEVEDLGKVPLVDGTAKIYLTEAQRVYVVQTIWPAWFSSPTVSGGERRILVFPEVWVKDQAKGWKYCSKQENAAYWKANKP